MRRFLCMMLLLCGGGVIHASDLGPHSSREALSREARSGDEASAWSLGWLYYSEGRYAQALAAIQSKEPGDADRTYFKSWLLVSQGSDIQAASLMESSKCLSDECVGLSAVIAIRRADYKGAATSYANSFSRRKIPEVYVKMLGALLLAREYARFDLAIAEVDWKNSDEYRAVRSRVQGLIKDRALFSGQP